MHLKTILSLAAGTGPIADQTACEANVQLLATIAGTLLEDSVAPERRRPVSITNEILENLYSEAKLLRSKAHVNNHCRLHHIGPIATAFLSNTNLKTLVSDPAQPFRLQLATYTYYEEGDRLDLHLDDPASSLSTVIMLRHDSLPGVPRSRLMLVAPEAGRIFYDLENGEAAIFQGSKVLHGREQLRAGESVILLVLLFKLS
ncbi:hypothetical protein AS026_29265 [Rhizobium altiplani]|uniref:Fe2OG dioxygenase domain-containing protein n=2 Tax=Rhizobium/Agrobacterium group TaxID=227290 RepID=A0A109K1X5_9HYPH|nr:hypothetical protein AS026_29265 [Rhizobium altiplani]